MSEMQAYYPWSAERITMEKNNVAACHSLRHPLAQGDNQHVFEQVEDCVREHSGQWGKTLFRNKEKATNGGVGKKTASEPDADALRGTLPHPRPT